MPANSVHINLLGETDMEHTPVGRIVNWAVTYGRYIMIGTEIVVLLAFISRFSLDRKLTDLKEEVTQKQEIIEANLPFEQDMRALQNKLAKIKTLKNQSANYLSILTSFQTIVPTGVYLTSLAVDHEKITVSAVAGSTGSFAQFITNLQSTRILADVDIGDITRNPIQGITFTFTATIPGAKK